MNTAARPLGLGLRRRPGLRWRKTYVLWAGAVLGVVGIAVVLRSARGANERPRGVTSDEGEMVAVPGGRFLMGSDHHGYDERPVHAVTLSAFRMDRFEVTYGEYRRFLERNPAWSRRRVTTKEADLGYLSDWHEATFRADLAAHPVVNVSWYAANAYCAWAGKALPTEAQWEYASRGGAAGQAYPWGNELAAYLVQSRRSGSRGTVRVGSYTVNGFGINDLAGNVREWTASGYQMYPERPETDPAPGVNRHLKVVRGGSWNSDEDSLRVSAREASAPTRCAADLGFRCVATTRP